MQALSLGVPMEIEESPNLLKTSMTFKHLAYTSSTVVIDPVANPERLDAHGSVLLDKENPTSERINVGLNYPDKITLESAKTVISRAGVMNALLEYTNAAGLECSIERQSTLVTKDYRLVVHLDPYTTFNASMYGHPENHFRVVITRESNSQQNTTVLNFKRLRYESLKGNSSQVYASNPIDNDYQMHFEWSEEELTNRQFRQIQDLILAGLKVVAATLVEANDCGSITPGQRGKHRICQSCDWQLSCVVSKGK